MSDETPTADAIAEVWYEFREYVRADNLLNRGHHLSKLGDAIGDLSTFHPHYNVNTGDIDGVYEDD